MQLSSAHGGSEDRCFFRAAAYAVAVLVGHAHHRQEAQEVLRRHVSSLEYLDDPKDILLALWTLANSTTDALSLASLLLAVRHVIALTAATPDATYVLRLVELLGQAGRSLRATLAAASRADEKEEGRRAEQGEAAELLAAALQSLLDALEDGKLMGYAVTSTRLLAEVHDILRLPTPFHWLTMMGLEMAELIGRHQHYAHVLQLADSLSVLLQREAHDSQLRITRVLGCLSNAEPTRIYELADYGLVGALFQTFRRFKQHDAILVAVYGVKDANYNFDLVHGALSVLRTLLLVTDNRCRALFLKVFNVGQVQAVMDLHRAICQDVLAQQPALPPSQALVQLNAALHSLLIDMRTLHGESAAAIASSSSSSGMSSPVPPGSPSSSSLSSRAVTALINESLLSWREDLFELLQSPHPLIMPELEDLDPTASLAARQPLIRCLDSSGRAVKVRLVPEWPGVREVDTVVPASASLSELVDHVFDLYHFKKDGLRLYHVPRGSGAGLMAGALSSNPGAGAGLPFELTEDAALGSLLRLYGESKESMVVRIKSGIPILRMAEEPLVTPASKHAAKLALQEAGLHITGRMSETLDALYKMFADVALDNPEALGLKWDQFQRALRWGHGSGQHLPHGSKSRILWDLLDQGSGHLAFHTMAVALCTLSARQIDVTLAFLHQALAKAPLAGQQQQQQGQGGGGGVAREELTKFLHGIYPDRPMADARRLCEQMFCRWDREGRGCLGFEAFREAVKENDRVLGAIADLQEVGLFIDPSSYHHGGGVGSGGLYGQLQQRGRRSRAQSHLNEERVNPSHQHRSNRQHRQSRSMDFFHGVGL